MSNLGFYQMITTFIKRIGGPKVFVAAVAALLPAGYGAGKGIESGVKAIKKRIKQKDSENIGVTFDVIAEGKDASGKDASGLEFCIDDKFKVLEQDGNAVLIEKIGDKNNPYHIAGEFLESISNFRI